MRKQNFIYHLIYDKNTNLFIYEGKGDFEYRLQLFNREFNNKILRDKMEREKKRDSLLQLKANQTNKKQISLSEIHWPLQKLTLSENKTSSGENPAKTQDPFIGNYVNSGYDLPMLEEKGLKMLEMYCEKFRC